MPKKSSSKQASQNVAVASWETSKKASSKTPKPVLKKPAAVQGKPPSTCVKFGQEIDEIFAKKRKKPEQKTRKVTESVDKSPNNSKKRIVKAPKDDDPVTREKKRSKSKGSNVDMFENTAPPHRSRRKTGDGLVIYAEDELGIGKADAGGTRLCPFDCDCCF